MDKEHNHRRAWGLFILIFCLGFFLRWQYTFVDRLWPDESFYAWGALKTSENFGAVFSKEVSEFHPPLFTIYLSLWHFILPPEAACRFGALVFNSLMILGVYLLGARMSSFVGLLSALMLALIPQHISQSSHILLDGPLNTAIVFLIVLLSYLKDSNSPKYDLSVGLLASIVILLKWPGVIVVPLVGLYYLLTLNTISLKDRLRRLFVPFFVIGITISLLLLKNWFQLGRILPEVGALPGGHLVKPFWYYIVNFHNIIFFPFLVPFFLCGLFVLLKGHERALRLILIWFVLSFISVSLTRDKDFRYAILILPNSLLITALGLEGFLRLVFKNNRAFLAAQTASLIIVLLFFVAFFPKIKDYLDKGTQQFTGFREAGQWLKVNMPNDALLMTSSNRAMRYYSGINFTEFGGRIKALYPTYSLDELKATLTQIKGSVYWEMDYWERTQPAWVNPYPKAALNELSALGFEVVHVIERKIKIGDELLAKPVVIILRRPPQ